VATPSGTTAVFAAPATRQTPLRRLHSAFSTFSGTIGAVGSYTHQIALPATSADFSTTARLVSPALDPSSVSIWKFLLTDAENETATARVWGLNELIGEPIDTDIPRGEQVEWVGDFLGEIALIAGANTVVSGSRLLPALGFWADTITITTDETLSPGMRVITDSADSSASLLFDRIGYTRLIWEFKLGTCASVGAVYREV
jgi:hypothetical protein